MLPEVSLNLSGERFTVVYRLTGGKTEARSKADDICLEQTVEFPGDLVPDGDIHDSIVGRVEAMERVASGRYEAAISYAIETTGFEFVQFLNVMFGNTSLKPGVRVERLELPDKLLQSFKGPRFGREGLRALMGVRGRPLLCTALKPLGLPAEELAGLAYQFALGGIDFIKDDHGLADQVFAPFQERVQRCSEAVDRANRETGRRCLYLPNVPGPADGIMDRALFAKDAGAGGLLVSPGLLGLDSMRCIAEDDRIALPVMSHPALQGSFVVSPDSGIAHYVMFGQIPRLAGADASIFPNYGGRFSFSVEECMSIARGTSVAMSHIRPCFPVPSGGMSLDRVPEMIEVYGRDIISLVGGGLHKHGPDIVENCRHFRRLVEQL